MNKALVRIAIAVVAAFMLVACGDNAVEPITPTTQTSPTTSAPDTTTTTSADVVEVVRGQVFGVTSASASIRCNGGGIVYVVSDTAEVVIAGSCEKVDIPGSGGTVEILDSVEVEIWGSDNTVSVNEVDEIDIYGNGNIVVVGTVRDIDIEANDNTVTWGSGNPSIDDLGTGNTVTQG